MPMERRPYHREPEEVRRDALIAATLDLVAEGGLKAATVRAIALRADVTPGLIRHYFGSNAALIDAALRSVLDRLLASKAAAIAAAPDDPLARLATCIIAALRPPNMDPQTLLTWAGFLPLIRSDDTRRDEHGLAYGGFGVLIEELIRALPDRAGRDPRVARVACLAVMDGLWLEGCLQPDAYAPGELERIGLDACGRILGLDLTGHLPES
jgi:TetR/AcrR family transcriptional regulator, transcriptional repressor of bet genes